MPTGYTHAIADGITFNEFVWRCARGMGALIMMRDEPTDAPIPQRFEPSKWHTEALEKANARLKQLEAMSAAEIEAAAQAAFTEEAERFDARIREKHELRAKYGAILREVEAWTPPTPDHEGLKKFMAEQITGSIDFDCDTTYDVDRAPKRLLPHEWLNKERAEAHRNICHHSVEHEKEVARTESRNEWIAALRRSVPSSVSETYTLSVTPTPSPSPHTD